ncbi:MAG: FtsW/RodA/SpoVE family cell cycle protein [Bacteroidia bacterium]|nr:FtsW/RodA/SpoVE family cell cycle protein [Bacteroidia bacterium]
MGKKSRSWYFFEGLKGDKVVWMIVLTLIMWSIVCIFSSTSTTKEVMSGTSTRVDVVLDLLKVIVLGVLLMLGCYNFIGVKGYRKLAQLGFGLSALLLVVVVSHFDSLPFFKAGQINGAWRVIKIGGLQLHIYEVIKVAMVMYLAWAVDAFQNKDFKAANLLSKLNHFHWLGKPGWQKVIYIYAPMFFVMVLVALGSGSSSVFIGGIMFVTILIGGLGIKELIKPALVLVALVGGTILLNKATDGRLLAGTRLETWESRLKGSEDSYEAFHNAKPKSIEYYEALDDLRQPYSAKIALKQGGLIGKGAGQSTQRYVVPVMYEDYMFSFIVEEYGLLGALVVIILYVSLLARGTIIVKHCQDNFGRITVAGLVLLISGQAMLHMFVNTGIMPLTGQTLPIISYGASSFVVFCIAFGVILSISRDTTKKIDKETKNAEPLKIVMHEGVQGELEVLDSFESNDQSGDIEDFSEEIEL